MDIVSRISRSCCRMKQKACRMPVQSDKEGRLIQEMITFTIDGADAKDLTMRCISRP